MSFKLGYLAGDEWREHSYAPLFKRASARDVEWLVLGVPHGDPLVLEKLLDCLEEPYFLLYVLHTPRGEAEPGRYQSPSLDRAKTKDFLHRFSGLLSNDARQDFWIHSPSSHGTLVWDRHNLIHAYGPLECYEQELRALGFSEGAVEIPVPHAHHYRDEFDAEARNLIGAFDWRRAPLQPQDEQ